LVKARSRAYALPHHLKMMDEIAPRRKRRSAAIGFIPG
jgi:hypothetical protein